MAIKFTNVRNFATGNTAHMFYNAPLASQSFKIRVESAGPVAGTVNVLVRNIFDFKHQFWSGSPSSAVFNLQLNGVGGAVQTNVTLTVGSVYVICLIWNGTAGVQTCYVNGVPQIMGHIAGLTANRVDPIQIGPLVAQSSIVYTLGDYNAWDNYGLTQADAQFLTNNGDPTTIGAGAPWRCRWTLDGTPGATATIGEAGLKNAYGTGADFTTAAGAGTAIYQAPLVWAPTVTATPYVAGCGKIIAATLALNTDGSPAVATQLLTTPTITVNGVDLGPLEKPWLTGFHQCVFYGTPNSVFINPGDTVSLSAPPAWCTTPAGPVGALSGTIGNRSGRSSVGVDALAKTLRLGLNHPSPGGLEYYPFRNAIYKTFNEVVNQPFEAGLLLHVWDTNPGAPVIPVISSGAPSRVTVSHLSQYDVSPGNGVGYVRVYQIAYVPGSDYETQTGGSGVEITLNWQTCPNTWIYLPGEWDIVDGAPVFDRSDRLALSRIYQDRVAGMGSGRSVDMTACGGACETYPYPELLLSPAANFFWGYNPIQLANVGLTSIGPVDTAATPWIYSAEFRQPENLFTATLADTISTTPAAGTHETWHFSDGATAPLMAGLEVQVDNEIVRILSGSVTDWVVYRGSNGTTPASHAAGTVTVFGRQPITKVIHPDGTAPYTAPCFVQCNAPHGLTTLQGYYPVTKFPPILMADGSTDAAYSLANFYCTGPTTFASYWSGWYTSKPAGTKPAQTYTLNPSTSYLQKLYFPRMPVEVFCNLVSRQPDANLHINIPKDACRDMIRRYAELARDNFPAGRKIYVERMNEPFNGAYPFQANSYCLFMFQLAMPQSLSTGDYRGYYAYTAIITGQIFDEVFGAAGRGGEIKLIANCQMNSGATQVTPYLNIGLAMGRPFDGIACAPYYSMGVSGNGLAATVAACNLYDDDQACEQLLHDITYDPSGIIGWIKNVKNAVNAYNTAHGKSCIMIGYEGGIEYAAPTGAANQATRSTDLQYNPNFYGVEQGWYKILQENGFDHLHIYGLGIGWPSSWGMYHTRTQHHSRGDGLNGAADNRLYCFNPANIHHATNSYLQHDIHNDSVRGQAFLDWNAAFDSTASTGAVGLAFQDDIVAAASVVNTLTQGTIDLDLHGDTVSVGVRPKRVARPDPFNASGVSSF